VGINQLKIVLVWTRPPQNTFFQSFNHPRFYGQQRLVGA